LKKTQLCFLPDKSVQHTDSVFAVFAKTESVCQTDFFVQHKKITESVLSFLQEVDQRTGGGEMKAAKIEIYELYFT